MSDAAAAFRRARSEAWLRDFAHQSNLSYEELLECIEQCVADGSYCFGADAPADMFGQNPEEFWRHYETATGAIVENAEDLYFRCAC